MSILFSQYSIETQLSGPKEGATSFGVDSISGTVSLQGKDPLDFDAGYHVINAFIYYST